MSNSRLITVAVPIKVKQALKIRANWDASFWFKFRTDENFLCDFVWRFIIDCQKLDCLKTKRSSHEPPWFYSIYNTNDKLNVTHVAGCSNWRIITVRQILHKGSDQQVSTYHFLIDFKTTYNNLDRVELWKNMDKNSFSGNLTALIRAVRNGVQNCVKMSDTKTPIQRKAHE